jgi:hypothetical protein
VAQGVDAKSGNEIQIALALDVKQKYALTPAQHDGISVIGLQQKMPLAFGDLFKVIHRKFQFYRILGERSRPCGENELHPENPVVYFPFLWFDPMIHISHPPASAVAAGAICVFFVGTS